MRARRDYHRRCEHGRRKAMCKECGGTQVCKHGVNKFHCIPCEGKHICVHKRQRFKCAECGGFLVLAKRMHRHAKGRSKQLSLPFEITVDDILVLMGDGFCPVLGLPFNLKARKLVDGSATLDKFNPLLGYVRGNCTVISKLANTIKQNTTSTQVRRVADWMEAIERRCE